MLKSLLLATELTAVQIATIVLIMALSLAILAIVIILCVYFKKQSKSTANANTTPSQPKQQSPIIIHETKKVKVPTKVIYVTVPASAPVEQVKEVEEVDEEPVAEEPIIEEPVVEESVVEEIAVAAAPAPAPVDESENAMRYNRSFRARLIQSEDDIKEWYGTLKNYILAHDRMSSRISWKYESFNYRRNAVAKIFIKGKTLYLYLPLNAADYADTKYKLDDVSKVAQFADTPALYKLKSEKRIRYAQDLIDDVCAKLECKQIEREPVDYYEPYNSDIALIKKGLVKRVIEDASKSFIGATGFSKAQDKDTEFDDKK